MYKLCGTKHFFELDLTKYLTSKNHVTKERLCIAT